jgi:TonB-linked SusC/RagA family outer membrane protein
MKKKLSRVWTVPPKLKKTILRTKLSLFLLLFFCLPSVASPQKVSVEMRGATLDRIFREIVEQTDIDLIYDTATAEKIRRDASLRGTDLRSALATLLAGTPLDYEVSNGIYVIVERKQAAPPATVTGTVRDAAGKPIAGASVTVKGTSTGARTEADGSYSLRPTGPGDAVLLFSFIGKKSVEIALAGQSVVDVTLEDAVENIAEVVVTGIYTRAKDSFTGSATTYTATELKSMGTSNVLQSLKTLDPSFAILENNEFGSDPNRLPNMEVRGKSSMLGIRDGLDADPNQPLFILDGFESTVRAIMDLDINRVASITVLKDAASTAIYGSKAANGVVVVETVKPVAGQLRVNYNGSLNVAMPDLTGYNLMNAREKLEFDRLSGRFGGTNAAADVVYRELYSEKLRAVESGVDTYWLAEPLRVGANQKHSLYVEGGEGGFVFGLGGSFNGNSGVMKESSRRVIAGNTDLIYRVSKFQFSNKFSINSTRIGNPVVDFQQYARAIPYYKKRNDDGQVDKWLENNDYFRASNPLWNASRNSRNTGANVAMSDYFIAEYTPSAEWKLRARFGLTYQNNDAEVFFSRDDTRYENVEETRKGEFSTTDTRLNQYDGELTATWAKMIGRHRINAVAGGNVYSSESLVQGYSAVGFPEGDFSYPSFSNGYPENGVPVYYENIGRSINGYLNTGYAFDDRYLVDFNLRTSGSSVFGTSKKYNTTWSVGMGWNIHREKLIADNAPWIDLLKLRASVGNPGNQSFDSGQTLLTYAFQYGSVNYFGLGAVLNQVGNPDLEWQTTLDRNVGIDITLLDKRLALTADYYNKVTDPLLIKINTPGSSGVKSYLTNAGRQLSSGLTVSASYHIIRDLERRFLWTVRGNVRTQRVRLDDIGDKLADLNDGGRGVNTTRYYDNADPDDIWAVRSMGIDPATGRELFRRAGGGYTFDFSYDDEVRCGNRRPDAEGVVGSQLTWKGLTLSVNMRYQMGADVFNTAMFDKVENMSRAQLAYNQDRRALYDRWKNPGDIARFKDIANSASTPASSRFVQRDDNIALESLHLSYEFFGGWVDKAGFSTLKVYLSMRDAFRLSTITAERGISYPFARTLETGVSFNF